MPRVVVSIGSNVDREHNVVSGLRALEQRFGPVRRSPVYRSTAVGFEGPDFFNLVAAFDVEESPKSLLGALHEIEDLHGRRRDGPRFAPRTLDLDLLLYGDLVRHDDVLDIPRDEIMRHAFVLRPLADLVPGNRHPELGVTFAGLWAQFNDPQQKLWRVPLSGER